MTGVPVYHLQNEPKLLLLPLGSAAHSFRPGTPLANSTNFVPRFVLPAKAQASRRRTGVAQPPAIAARGMSTVGSSRNGGSTVTHKLSDIVFLWHKA